ncbi:MAG: transcriptional regulator, TetR family [Chitinophagaceae bacterium]|nr:transcriptional regulator, TetR family [Chitinophagaceae bacterium]
MARIKTEKDVSRRDIIVKAAAELFKEKGYKAASMRDLAEQVGVEAASLYNHIKSKTELLHDVCFNVANRFFDHINELEASPTSTLEKIEALIRFHIRQMIENYEEVLVSDREWKHLSEPYLSNFHNQRRNYRKRFAGLIQKGVDEKQIKNIDPSTSVLIILHAITGIDSWHRSVKRISAEELEENMVTLFVEGMKK